MFLGNAGPVMSTAKAELNRIRLPSTYCDEVPGKRTGLEDLGGRFVFGGWQQHGSAASGSAGLQQSA